MMKDRYLLYIDILGFSNLVTEDNPKIIDLYEVIASLHVHDHPSFRVIIFSDTILVYSIAGQDTYDDRSYLVMYLCEFAQDLQERLTGKDIFFRAVLVRGVFHHHELNHIPCFFGEALIHAHTLEKQIKAIGLFMSNDIIADSDIFPVQPFNQECGFVFITQALTRAERDWGGEFPVSVELMEVADDIYFLTPEVMLLNRLNHFAIHHPIKEVREKYLATLSIYKNRYPNTLSYLERNDFDLKSLCPGASWENVADRWPQSYTWAIKERKKY